MSKKNKFSGLLSAMASSAAVILLFVVPAFAQLSTGKIEGTVTDKSTGQALAGAQVAIEGTRLGNITNADGYYFILNVPPGRRDITISYTGYQQITITSQLILAGHTATVDIALSSTVIELGGITVEAEADLLIPRDNTVTKHRLTAENIAEMPATTLEDLLVLEAGVQIGGQGGWSRGLRIRGGRMGEEAMVIDGVSVRNYTADPFRSGLGWVWEQELGSLSEDITPLEFSTGSVEEVDIITGGFQAEYGNAQSGIINIVTKEGGPSLKGNVRFTTDEQNPRTADYGYNQLQVNIGGPVPGIPNLFFHGSGEIQGMADRSPTHADEGFRGIDQRFVDKLNNAVRNDQVLGAQMPAYTLEMLQTGRAFFAENMGLDPGLFSPVNPVRQPDNWGDRTLASGKLTFSPVKGLKFIGSTNFSRYQQSYPNDYFNNGWITPSMVPDRNWAADPDTVVYIPQTYGRRTRTSNLLAGFNYELTSAVRSASLQFRYTDFRTQDVNSANLKDDYTHDNTFMGWTPHDIPFELETFPNREFPRTPEQASIYFPDGVTGWSHSYGYPTPFLYVNNAELYWLTYRYLRENHKNYKTDLDFQWNRQNRAKIGLLYTDFDNHKFDINPMIGRNQRDLGNEFEYAPKMYAFYLQNRTDLGDLVFNYGLRYDSFKPEVNWGPQNEDQWGERFSPQDINEWSPRFDVGFPVTDKSQIRFAYGVFTQLPSMSYIYSGVNPGGLEYSRTDAFEAGLSYLLSNDMVLDLVAYYRDVQGNVAEGKEFFRDYYLEHSERRVREYQKGIANRDNGNIKGMDLTLKRRFANNLSFNLIYTMQFSRTTGSNSFATKDYNIFMDPTTGEEFRPPDEIRPILGDRTHKFTVYANYLFPDDFQSGTTANLVLKNLRVNAIFTLMSGEPILDRMQLNYTQYNPLLNVEYLTRRGGTMVGGVNYFRGRWDTNLDLKLSKSLYLGGGRRLSVFSEIFNVLNHKVSTPYPSGQTYEGNRWGPTGGVDLYWDDPNLTLAQRHRFQADFNGDGVLTVMEAAKGNIANSVMSQTMAWQAWGPARQIRMGLDFTF